MNEYLELIVRILISMVILIVMARLTGAKQITQLTYYDYVVGITIGSIAGTLCLDLDIPIYFGIIGIVLFMLSSMLVSFLTNKSIVFRRLLTGVPEIIIAGGEILFNGLKKAKFDINDLLRELRSQGYFDINEINFAILEPNGAISVMPKAETKSATVSDMKIKVEEDELKANVIIDGKVLDGNLTAFNKDRDWLFKELKKQKVVKIKDVLLAVLDSKGNLSIYFKNIEKIGRTSLE